MNRHRRRGIPAKIFSYWLINMSSFTENVNISPLPKENKRITTKPFVYHIGKEESNEVVVIPTWYVFDGASVPMVFGCFIQRVEPRTISAACLHDYLYTEWRRYSLIKTDLIFYESLIASWVCKIKAFIMYIWVFLGWWLYWYKIL